MSPPNLQDLATDTRFKISTQSRTLAEHLRLTEQEQRVSKKHLNSPKQQQRFYDLVLATWSKQQKSVIRPSFDPDSGDPIWTWHAKRLRTKEQSEFDNAIEYLKKGCLAPECDPPHLPLIRYYFETENMPKHMIHAKLQMTWPYHVKDFNIHRSGRYYFWKALAFSFDLCTQEVKWDTMRRELQVGREENQTGLQDRPDHIILPAPSILLSKYPLWKPEKDSVDNVCLSGGFDKIKKEPEGPRVSEASAPLPARQVKTYRFPAYRTLKGYQIVPLHAAISEEWPEYDQFSMRLCEDDWVWQVPLLKEEEWLRLQFELADVRDLWDEGGEVDSNGFTKLQKM